jgi:hypothetical protein
MFMGKYAWSPEWQEAKEPVLFLKLVLKKKQGGKVKTHYLQRLQRRCRNKDWWKLSLEEIMSRLSAAEVQFDAECVRAGTLRLRFLDRLAEDLAKKNDTTTEVELRKLNNVAKQKKQAARIRNTSVPIQIGGLSTCERKVLNRKTLRPSQFRFGRIRDASCTPAC